MTDTKSDRIAMAISFWLCFAIGVLTAVAIFHSLWQGEIPDHRLAVIVVAMALMCWLTKRALKKGDRR